MSNRSLVSYYNMFASFSLLIFFYLPFVPWISVTWVRKWWACCIHIHTCILFHCLGCWFGHGFVHGVFCNSCTQSFLKMSSHSNGLICCFSNLFIRLFLLISDWTKVGFRYGVWLGCLHMIVQDDIHNRRHLSLNPDHGINYLCFSQCTWRRLIALILWLLKIFDIQIYLFWHGICLQGWIFGPRESSYLLWGMYLALQIRISLRFLWLWIFMQHWYTSSLVSSLVTLNKTTIKKCSMKKSKLL